jgi:Bacterial SH3 domain
MRQAIFLSARDAVIVAVRDGALDAGALRSPLVLVSSSTAMKQQRPDMRKSQKIGVALVSIGALALSTTALAAPALTRVSAGMREGPSSNAPVVQEVPAYTEIDVRGCQGSWCYVSWRYIFGYLPRGAIDPRPFPGSGPVPPPPGAYVAPPAVVVAPAVGFGWSFGPGWRGRW